MRAENEGVKLSISKEDMDFLTSEDGFKKMQQDVMDLYAMNAKQQQKLAEGRDPSDKFWNNTGDQWLTFSEELDKTGFYDNMSDEQGFRKYVSNAATGLFEDMQKYWGNLMNRINSNS